jgi:predicted DsbA family dithiol-disulfide isomerase
LPGVSEPIKVDIWSDVQCPWCYIGKRKFESGAAQFDGEIQVEYHSFELAPDTPVDYAGTPADYMLEHRGIPREQFEQMTGQVTAIAAAVGLDYHFDKVHQTNTLKAHELLHYAKTQGRQVEMNERLMKAYFVDGAHLGRIDDLADLAAEVGLDREEAVAALADNRFTAAVAADIALARDYGIQGVPFFVIDNKYGVSGAQEAATFTGVLERVRSERDGHGSASVGDNEPLA